MKRRATPDSHREPSEQSPSRVILKVSNLAILALVAGSTVLACGSSDAKHVERGEQVGGDATAGGSGSDGGVSASSGTGGTGGSVDQGGGNGPGGDASSGGAGDGGMGNGSMSSGGVSDGGVSDGGTSDGGTNACVNPEPLPKAPPNPSAGCSKLDSSEIGSAAQPLTIAGHTYYVKLPTAYDPTTPYPVVYVFHPVGNSGWAEQYAGYETNGAQDAAIRVYPAALSVNSPWLDADLPFFGPLHEKITADYCVDQERAFAAGESPGGTFAARLGCAYGDILRAVAGVPYGYYRLTSCVGQVAAVVIHGKYDAIAPVMSASKIRDDYVELNHCGSTTTPLAGYTDPLSNCLQYDCCDAGQPVFWCEHTDPKDNGNNHGWPVFARTMTWEVFASF